MPLENRAIQSVVGILMFDSLFRFQTALHWAAKHGNEDVVKLIAGTRKADVNARTVIITWIKIYGNPQHNKKTNEK